MTIDDQTLEEMMQDISTLTDQMTAFYEKWHPRCKEGYMLSASDEQERRYAEVGFKFLQALEAITP